ncbi:NUDIX hydrolase [Nocardia sp. NRRL S-836]|uniref:NUDIX hydrolase n=1 Tax=Nocardia sp. NRRL S-836 TaxID=1519492 RepID=UPI0006ADB0E6|nr:NUDIX domain-containing protein [Nocardia sp. NRRL S-836]
MEPEIVVDPGVRLPGVAPGQVWVVGAVVLDVEGRAFVQFRSARRRLFPCTWDVVGGHVEHGETVVQALRREIAEETGWVLRRVVRDLGTSTWEAGDGIVRHAADFVVEVEGDLSRPELEWEKHPRFAWVGADGLSLLMENRAPGDTAVHDVVARALGRPGWS